MPSREPCGAEDFMLKLWGAPPEAVIATMLHPVRSTAVRILTEVAQAAAAQLKPQHQEALRALEESK